MSDVEKTVEIDPMDWALDQSNGSAPLSVLDRLKKQRNVIAETRTVDIGVPGFAGLLVLRLGVLPRKKLAEITTRAAKPDISADELFNLNADTLINACREVLARNSRDEPLRSIDPDGETVKIDTHLARLLGMPDATRSREVVQVLFGAVPSPELAVGVATGEYMTWASSANDELDEEFQGE
jgi:hypothetical protein